MSIQILQAHYGFSRVPFGRDLASGMLHTSTGHAEAVARIDWCISERALGVVTGEVGSGKTVAARAATAALDASRHTTIYLGNPAIGARGLYSAVVSALGGVPRFHKASLLHHHLAYCIGCMFGREVAIGSNPLRLLRISVLAERPERWW